MRTKTATRRTRSLQFGVPAAVLGALAATLTAAPAEAAATTTDLAPVERHRSMPVRVVPAQAAPASYVVRPGDTVSSIASRFGLRTVDVLAWNHLSWRSVIYPGQTLTLRTAAASPAPAPAPAAATSTSHKVVAGDTVYAIAQKYGTTVDAVLAANGLTRASVIYPGQALAVTGSAAPVAAPAAAPASAPTPAATASHMVVAGDTVYGIAQKYGITTLTVFALNGLARPRSSTPGRSSLFVRHLLPHLPQRQQPRWADSGLRPSTASRRRTPRSSSASVESSASPDRGIALALATGMVESGLRNLDWGDRDSLGIFQQRPSTGWGTPAQIMDADRSTRVFYGGRNDPRRDMTRGLLDIAGWESMPFTSAAQAVQISAYPDKYGQWETQALQLARPPRLTTSIKSAGPRGEPLPCLSGSSQ